MKRTFKQIVAGLITVSFSWMSFGIPLAQATMVETSQLVESTQLSSETGTDRARVLAFLDREQVQQELLDRGVSPDEAKMRVANLNDDEVQMLAGKIDQLPAGGLVGEIIGLAALIFIVLLITDILGFTDVYPFVNHR